MSACGANIRASIFSVLYKLALLVVIFPATETEWHAFGLVVSIDNIIGVVFTNKMIFYEERRLKISNMLILNSERFLDSGKFNFCFCKSSDQVCKFQLKLGAFEGNSAFT